MPRLAGARTWISSTRDLGSRYLLEGTTNSASTQLRNYGVGLLLGLTALGYVQASSTLMGPFMVIFFGMGLVTLPEAARILRRSPAAPAVVLYRRERRARCGRAALGSGPAARPCLVAWASGSLPVSGGRPTRWYSR